MGSVGRVGLGVLTVVKINRLVGTNQIIQCAFLRSTIRLSPFNSMSNSVPTHDTSELGAAIHQ